jgi:hypothetical protein
MKVITFTLPPTPLNEEQVPVVAKHMGWVGDENEGYDATLVSQVAWIADHCRELIAEPFLDAFTTAYVEYDEQAKAEVDAIHEGLRIKGAVITEQVNSNIKVLTDVTEV